MDISTDASIAGDNSTVDSSTTETSQDNQPGDKSVPLTFDDGADSQQTELTSPDGQQDLKADQNLPFHKHPRWIEQQTKLKDISSKYEAELVAKQEIEQQKSEYEQLIADIQRVVPDIEDRLKGRQPANQLNGQAGKANQGEADNYIAKLPAREFKKVEEYKDIADLYQDIRTAMIEDLKQYSSLNAQEQQQQQSILENRLAGIRRELGSNYDNFRSFATKTIGKFPNLDIDTVFGLYKEISAKPVAAQAKTASKMAGNSRQISSPSTKIPYSKLKNMDWDQVTDYAVQQFKI